MALLKVHSPTQSHKQQVKKKEKNMHERNNKEKTYEKKVIKQKQNENSKAFSKGLLNEKPGSRSGRKEDQRIKGT